MRQIPKYLKAPLRYDYRFSHGLFPVDRFKTHRLVRVGMRRSPLGSAAQSHKENSYATACFLLNSAKGLASSDKRFNSGAGSQSSPCWR